ncbi:hypothetical protein [Lyngbya confervoides]|uniref:Uncharacterized protein n=1 Tax=Lyngbya confervoides BDU141951 TaxID=1574623 RepID=A0ABD4T1L5_9CYAN|nr:hypothetical protein [Lyngbya confervoides]MCM1982531.1 hypothetical protein [Lyngbya confervoides BDU141951]
MKQVNFQRLMAAMLLCVMLLITGCQQAPPSPYADVQAESTQRNAPKAIVKEATQGSQFNQFFPKPGEGYERVYTQEKKGFAEAKLKQSGKTLAMLSISDTVSLPTAAAKYAQSNQTIAGYPAVTLGNTQTSVLVGDRYQVKILSRDPSFTAADRQAWIQKFDLSGLGQLQASAQQ